MGINYSIIHLILLYRNIKLKGIWSFILYFLMMMISGFCGAIGLVQFANDSNDENTLILLFIFIIIMFARVFIPIRIMQIK